MRAFSQNYEDGALLLIFAIIGTTNRTLVEMCAGNGLECNTTNLIVNHGWSGLLVDGNADNVATGTAFFARHPDTWAHPPTFRQVWLTRDNANEVIRSAGIAGPIDLFSLDLGRHRLLALGSPRCHRSAGRGGRVQRHRRAGAGDHRAVCRRLRG
ncbi:MAG: hypothetical protein IPM08_15210 [Actinomycetales bacterium]|nr:hypothetical protein [Actinomycetales bacterium]